MTDPMDGRMDRIAVERFRAVRLDSVVSVHHEHRLSRSPVANFVAVVDRTETSNHLVIAARGETVALAVSPS